MIKMNQKRWIPIVLAMLTLGACSDDEVSDNGNEPQWNTAGKGYISLSLNLPTTGPNSKAESFEGGDESEYYVHDAKLLIFTGNKTESGDVSDTKFHSAYNLDLSNQWDDKEGQVTTSTNIIQEINSYQSDDVEAYALVVLNSEGIITVDDEKGAKINGTTLEKGTTTWGTVQKMQLSSTNFSTESGILMLNAPLANKPGGTDNPSGAECTTLAPLHKNRIYESAEKAANGAPAAIVYAERVVAKVSVSVAPELKGATLTDQNVPCDVTGWVLDNTNTVSYLGHVVNREWFPYYSRGTTPNDYRFVGSESVSGGGTDDVTRKLYRCYWAEDPNYNIDGTFNTATAVEDLTFLNTGTTASAYCFENTFSIEKMRNNQITRAIVRVQFNGGETFYTVSDDENVLYNGEESLNNHLKEILKKLPDFNTWLSSNELTVDEKFTFKYATKENAKGQQIISSITVENKDVPKAIINELNKYYQINVYQKGNAYYPVLIKHFGDAQTPWGTWEEEPDKPSADGSVYPGKNAAANYLGRYGVVRNNWYELNITSINKLGYPDVPPIENIPADNMDAYISVEINVLSWAKRTQKVDL